MNDGESQPITNGQSDAPLQPAPQIIPPQQTAPATDSAASVQPLQNNGDQMQPQPLPVTYPHPQLQPDTVVQPQQQPLTASQTTAKKPRSKKALLLTLVVPLLLIGAAAYGYFGVYMQTPQQLWNSAMKNTGEGLKSFANTPTVAAKTTKINGTVSVTQPSAIELSIDGAVSGSTSLLKESIGISGLRINVESRTLLVGTATTPDVYLKVDGIKGLGGLFGGAALGATIDGIDNKWYVVDHTLIDQLLATASESQDQQISTAELSKELTLLKTKVADVVATYLFSTDDAKAMVVMKEAKEKEDFKGRPSQHVVAQLRKEQTHDMFVALKDAFKDTKLDEWIVGADNKKSFEEVINFTDLLKQVDNANYDNAIADVWIDTGLRYVRNVRLTMSDNTTPTAKDTLDFMLDYTGGDEFPFSISIESVDSKDTNGKGVLGLTFKKGSPDLKVTGELTTDGDGQKMKGSMQVTLTGSDEELKVDKPEGAMNIINLIGSLQGEFRQLQNNLTRTLGVSTLKDDTQL